jgi:succinoglycan biosynthesis transport protein ExoP
MPIVGDGKGAQRFLLVCQGLMVSSERTYRSAAVIAPAAFRGARVDSPGPAVVVAEGADLRDLVAILASHRRFIAACVLIALALAGAYLLTARKSYTATVSILVDARGRGPIGSDQSNALNISPDATLVESQVKLLSSDTVLRRVVIRENLGADPEFVPTQPGLRATILAMIGLGSPAPIGEDRTTRALAAFSRGVSVKRSERTYVIDVDVVTSDPQKSARLANDIADAYLADQQDAKSDVVQRDSVWLKQRVADLQERVREADNKVQRFKQEHRITDANGKLVNEQELSELTTELARARARTSDAKARSDQMQRILASGKIPEAVPDALKSTGLDRLKAQYAEIVRQEANFRTTLGERHPALQEVQTQLRDTRQLIVTEVKRIAESAVNEYQQARANEAEMGRRAEGSRDTTNLTNQAIVELKELERDADATRTVFERFLRARESITADLTEGPASRVIAPASPPTGPSSPKSFAILAIALASGLFLGAGGALVREYVAASSAAPRAGATIFAESAAPAALLRPVGRVPFVGNAAPRSALQRARDLINLRAAPAVVATEDSLLDAYARDPASAFSRAITDAAQALGLNADRRGTNAARSLLVVSPTAGAGKTAIAVNLARAAAATGASVLLIDANPTNPSLRQLFDTAAQPGLIDLPGETRMIYPIDVSGKGELYVVPILDAEAAAVRRLSRRSMTQRFEGIGANFDLVIMDGPSLDDADHARLLAGAADRTVMVVDASNPGALQADAALADLSLPKRKFAGVIFSKAPASGLI